MHQAAGIGNGQGARTECRFLPDQPHHEVRIKSVEAGLGIDELPVRLGIEEIPNLLRQVGEFHLRIGRCSMERAEQRARRIALRGVGLGEQQAQIGWRIVPGNDRF